MTIAFFRSTLFVVLILTTICSCGRFGNEDKKKDHKQRIVCISKQYNEIIFALKAQDDIVAVDLTSTYPPEIKKLPNVGYHRALSIESILAMKPTIIIQDNNIGPEACGQTNSGFKNPHENFRALPEHNIRNRLSDTGNGSLFS